MTSPALAAVALVVIALALVAIVALMSAVVLPHRKVLRIQSKVLRIQSKVLRIQVAREEERGKLEVSYYATLIKHAQAGLKAPAEFDRLLQGLEGMVKLAGIGVEVTQKQLARREAQDTGPTAAPMSKGARREAKEAALVDALVDKHAQALGGADDETLAEAAGPAGGLNGVPRVTRVDYDSAGPTAPG